MLLLTLLLLPFAAARIDIDITPGTRPDSEVTVNASGSALTPTTEDELELFQITNEDIIFNLRIRGYTVPTSVHTLDSYKYGYKRLMTNLIPVRASVLGHEKRTVLVTEKYFENNSSVPIIAKGGIKEEVTETVSSTWTRSGELAIGREISFKYAKLSFDFKTAWGESIHKSTTKTLSTTSDIEVSLKPGQRVKAVMKATRALLKVRVDHEVRVQGEIYCQYTIFIPNVYGQQFEVNKFLDLITARKLRHLSEVFSVDYYYGAHVVITDMANGEELFSK